MIATRALGRSALRPTTLGFGGGPAGHLQGVGADQQVETAAAIAWQGGIRYFDTAPLYGHGQSERRLGRFLRHQPRDDFVVSTKVGRLFKGRGGPQLVYDYSRDGALVARAEPRTARPRPHRHRPHPRHRPLDARRGASRDASARRSTAPIAPSPTSVREGVVACHRHRRQRMAGGARRRPPRDRSTACCSPAATRCSSRLRRPSSCRSAVERGDRRHHRRAIQQRHPRHRRRSTATYNYGRRLPTSRERVQRIEAVCRGAWRAAAGRGAALPLLIEAGRHRHPRPGDAAEVAAARLDSLVPAAVGPPAELGRSRADAWRIDRDAESDHERTFRRHRRRGPVPAAVSSPHGSARTRSCRVLLLEAGPRLPGRGRAHALFAVSGEHRWRVSGLPEFDWGFSTGTGPAGAAGGRSGCRAARLVGGSSMVNSTIAVRPAAVRPRPLGGLGCAGWDWDEPPAGSIGGSRPIATSATSRSTATTGRSSSSATRNRAGRR